MATRAVLQSVARNVEVPSAVVLIAVTRTVVIHAVVQNVVVPNVAPLSVVRVAVRNVVIHDVVPTEAGQSAAIQFSFQVVIRVAPIVARTAVPIVVLVSVPYAVRCVVVNPASRVHDAPHDVLRGVLHDDSRVTAL